MTADSDYLRVIYNNIPRVLSLFDNEKSSKTYGIGDRNYWAWAQTDFPNGTYQGFVNGLTKLYNEGLLDEYFTQLSYMEFFESIFEGTKKSQNRNGSLNEAFPNEQSWCVTSLVAYDLITALSDNHLLDKQNLHKKIADIEPMLEFMKRNPESHAFISNHLVTGAAAFLKWQELTGDARYEHEAERIVKNVIKSGNSEGWFREYGGFDAGYQTITTQYLQEIFSLRPNWDTNGELNRSLEFISNFFNPDGSFGGMIGSRQTNFYYPGGFHLLSQKNQLAAKISNTGKIRLIKNQIVNLNAIDLGNLTPLFNSYCIAALNPVDPKIGELDPPKSSRKIYENCGIIIDIGNNHKTIVSLQKGGIVQHYLGVEEKIIDCGIIIKNKKGKLGTTQHEISNPNFSLNGSTIRLNSTIHEFARELPTPIKFAVIRILAITLFRNQLILKIFKKLIIRKLITNQKDWKTAYEREINLGEVIQIRNKLEMKRGTKIISNAANFSPIHMASRGYWQVGNQNHDS